MIFICLGIQEGAVRNYLAGNELSAAAILRRETGRSAVRNRPFGELKQAVRQRKTADADWQYEACKHSSP